MGTIANPEGITNPPIDELLDKTSSKYSLVIFAAKRARQVNAYYSQLGEGLLEYVGPLVETTPQEKPLSIAMREINSRPAHGRGDRQPLIELRPHPRPLCGRGFVISGSVPMPEVVLGVCGGIAAYKACELLRLFTESGHGVRVVPTASALKFVGAPTWAALSGRAVSTEVWDDAHEVPHVRVG
nr:hypothetical protein GCM10020092_029700 [Actinoplanes digitatis]